MDLSYILLIYAVAALLSLLGDRSARFALAVAPGLAWLLTIGAIVAGPRAELMGLRVDALSLLILTVISFVATAVGWHVQEHFQRMTEAGYARRFGALTNAFLALASLAVLASNLALMWAALEAMTLAAVFLVNAREEAATLEGAWKFVLVTTGAGLVALFGIMLLYAAQPEGVRSLSWATALGAAGTASPALMRIAFLATVVGFGAKAGLVPMHAWLPDTYTRAPAPACALLSGVEVTAAVYAIARMYRLATASGAAWAGQTLLLLGFLSLLLVALSVYLQRDFQRLLGYSSVEQVGIVVLALGFGGRLGAYAALFQLTNHAVTKALLFFTADRLTRRYPREGRADAPSDLDHWLGLGGVLRQHPGTGWLILLGGMALMGLPPFSLFASEVSVVVAGFASGRTLLTGLLVALLLLVFVGFLAFLNRFVFGIAARPVHLHGGRDGLTIQELVEHAHAAARDSQAPRGHWLGYGGLALVLTPVLLLGLYMPERVAQLLHQAATLLAP